MNTQQQALIWFIINTASKKQNTTRKYKTRHKTNTTTKTKQTNTNQQNNKQNKQHTTHNTQQHNNTI